MQAIVETLFDAAYLITVITLGIRMVAKSHGSRQYRLFGIMAIVLGAGDAFHLIPRAIALCTTGLENFTYALGIGKLITSVTMTIFYVLLYYVWRIRYQISNQKIITVLVYLLASLRILLCLFPQNGWVSATPPWLTIVLSFGFYIPVVLWADSIPLIGMLMIPKTCAYVWTVFIGYRAMAHNSLPSFNRPF